VRIVDNPAMHPETTFPNLRWDIFCRVIDNFGDIGVSWRLSCNLAQRGQTVRLWVDDAAALNWIAPTGMPGVEVLPWTTPLMPGSLPPSDVLVEAFGCDIDPEFIAAYAHSIGDRGTKYHWINLEYLSAEAFVQRCHGLPSPVMSGTGKGLTKHFFYPGFTAGTGGLLREPNLLERQANFDRTTWLRQQGLNWQGERLVSLFCYEPAGLGDLLDALSEGEQATCLLVTPGRASAAVQAEVSNKIGLKPSWNNRGQLSFFYLPSLSQYDFDHLLWASDVNFVRGEDSLVRALWAGKPLVWQIYPQDDGAHGPKLAAFLEWLNAPASLRQFHQRWNGLGTLQDRPGQSDFSPLDWQTCVDQARVRLLGQEDLSTQLLQFCSKNH
jgi:uncharacterized repeat protein (TIGR03837 family)